MTYNPVQSRSLNFTSHKTVSNQKIMWFTSLCLGIDGSKGLTKYSIPSVTILSNKTSSSSWSFQNQHTPLTPSQQSVCAIVCFFSFHLFIWLFDHILSSIPSLIPFPADTADGFCFVTFFFKSVSIWLHHPTLHSSISCLTPFPADPAGSRYLSLLHSFLSSVCPDHLTAAYVVWPPSLRMLLAPSGPRSARKSFFSQPESPENPEKWPLSSFPTFIDLKRVLCDRQK